MKISFASLGVAISCASAFVIPSNLAVVSQKQFSLEVLFYIKEPQAAENHEDKYSGLFTLENQALNRNNPDTSSESTALSIAEGLLVPVLSDVRKLKAFFDLDPNRDWESFDEIFDNVETSCNDLLGSESLLEKSVMKKISEILKIELQPFIEMSDACRRVIHKPEGYAGDYVTIDTIYNNEPSGTGKIGRLLDCYALDLVAAQAVRNRRVMIFDKINTLLSERSVQDGPLEVTSMACGPARELQDIFLDLQCNFPNINLHLVDHDHGALTLVKEWMDQIESFPHTSVSLNQKNLLYLASGRESIDIPPQDFMYSMGLIDYFKDRTVILLLDYIYDTLKDGGKVALGNFHVCNPNRGLMDCVLEWKFIHRNEEQLKDLFLRSKFASACDIIFDDTGVQMFAVCEKGRKNNGSLPLL